ncbi:Hypothetical predicted protein [Marmota monax]|uniref:Uncharacterized protein n=1 Tax=Marmota monax TaxID=9995 RepID=A0A5E4A2J3_MARMO|nr:Hypothetical predicted protein [Marmota monax]
MNPREAGGWSAWVLAGQPGSQPPPLGPGRGILPEGRHRHRHRHRRAPQSPRRPRRTPQATGARRGRAARGLGTHAAPREQDARAPAPALCPGCPRRASSWPAAPRATRAEGSPTAPPPPRVPVISPGPRGTRGRAVPAAVPLAPSLPERPSPAPGSMATQLLRDVTSPRRLRLSPRSPPHGLLALSVVRWSCAGSWWPSARLCVGPVPPPRGHSDPLPWEEPCYPPVGGCG